MGKDLRSQVGVLAFGRCVDGGEPGQSSAAEEVGGRDRARMGNFARAGGATSSARLVWRQKWVSWFVNRDGSRCLRGQAQSPSQKLPQVRPQCARHGSGSGNDECTHSGYKNPAWDKDGGLGLAVRSRCGRGQARVEDGGWDGRAGGGCWTRDSVAAAVRRRGLWRPKVPLVPWLVIPSV